MHGENLKLVISNLLFH